MKKSRFAESQIVSLLKEADARTMAILAICLFVVLAVFFSAYSSYSHGKEWKGWYLFKDDGPYFPTARVAKWTTPTRSGQNVTLEFECLEDGIGIGWDLSRPLDKVEPPKFPSFRDLTIPPKETHYFQLAFWIDNAPFGWYRIAVEDVASSPSIKLSLGVLETALEKFLSGETVTVEVRNSAGFENYSGTIRLDGINHAIKKLRIACIETGIH